MVNSVTQMKVVGIIPARFGSRRFPGKALVELAGKPLVLHVVHRAQQAKLLGEVIVATDDVRIAKAVEPYVRVEMTSPNHPSGTDRVAEVAVKIQCDAIVNIQGDEPLMDPNVIDAVASALNQSEMSTAATQIKDPSDLPNPNVVKVVVGTRGQALYFSRLPIPYLRDLANQPYSEQLRTFRYLKHLGIYGYRKETLLRLVRLPVSTLEKAEKLEQLRALENGIEIRVTEVEYQGIGVDTPEDLVRVEAILNKMARPFEAQS